MPTFSSRVRAPMVVAGLCVIVSGCAQLAALQARRAFKDAHALYSSQDYKAAAAKYEETIAADPSLGAAYFFLGNSLHNLHQPSRRGEPENDALLSKAVDNYEKALAMAQDDPKVHQLTLEYLVAAYGPDKLNDPAQQEPLLQEMIRREPNEPTAYFTLAKIYEDSGHYEAAEQMLLEAKKVRPTEAAVYTQLAGFYNRQGDFERTISALRERAQREPDNPEAHHLIATYYWDKVARDFRLTDTEKRQYLVAGIQSADRALELRSDYFEAISYKNLLLRLQANVETNRARQHALLREADRLRDQAQELRKKQLTGTARD